MSTKHLKMIVFISICVLGVLIFGFFGTRGLQTAVSTQTKTETRTETILPVSPRVFHKSLSPPQESLTAFQNTDFYRTIIDNNLFRPLGWTPPRPLVRYKLLGTLVSGATDGVWVSQAVIDVGGRVQVLGIGDALDTETTVLGIDRHSVVLETAGTEKVLTLPRGGMFLRGR